MVQVNIINFEQLNHELRKPETILIDVRSGEELKYEGKIPQSKNLHIADLKIVFKMTDDEFRKKYGFEKPRKNDHLIVHCKGGMRGQRFAGMLQEVGYVDVSVYPGLVDWKEHRGPVVFP